MGNDEEGAGVVDECFLQDVLRLHVEVVGGLVENEEVGRADQHADQGDAGALAAAEDSDFFEDIVAFEEETAEDIARGHLGAARLDLLHRFDHGEVGIEFVGVVLVEERGKGLWAEFVITGGGFLLAGDHAAEGGLTRAVGADDGDLFPTGHFEVEVFEDGEVAILLGRILKLRNEVGRGGRIGEAEGHYGILGIDLDAFDLGEMFDA